MQKNLWKKKDWIEIEEVKEDLQRLEVKDIIKKEKDARRS